jgi:hypothetical protein
MFVGVRAAPPPGGGSDVRCALDATVAADGSLTGPVAVPDPSFAHAAVIERVFPQPGRWTCVARGVAEGLDENFDTVTFSTPWSAPLAFDVASDFRRRTGAIAKARTRRPRLRFKAEWPAASAGGAATVTLYRVKGCRRSGGYKRRRIATYRGRFDAKRLQLRIARPKAGVFIGRFDFAGTRFIRAGVDPFPVLMSVQRGRMGFMAPNVFPACGA